MPFRLYQSHHLEMRAGCSSVFLSMGRQQLTAANTLSGQCVKGAKGCPSQTTELAERRRIDCTALLS